MSKSQYKILKDTHKTLKILKNFIRDKLVESGLNGYVIGVSGGVDSAVVSKLCSEECIGGYEEVVAVSMPIGKTSAGDKRARSHLGDLKADHPSVETDFIDLTDTYETMKGQLGKNNINSDLMLANLKSRLRMATLYSIANERDLLVAGTDNRVEGWLGFFTKGGDGVVDVNPLGNLYKTQVWNLAGHIGIREEIVNATPTDGLWENNRSDESQLGASYETIESIMIAYERDELWRVKQRYGIELVEKIVEQHETTRHKIGESPAPEIPLDI